MPDLASPAPRPIAAACGWLARQGLPRRVATPLVIQEEAAECGLAALAIVLGHHGVHVGLETLRRRMGTVRNGATARDLAALAAASGFSLRAARIAPERFGRLELPVILHWRFNHFVVLEAVEPGRIRINDPAGGPRWLGADEIDEDFTGVALLLRPGPTVAPVGRAFSLRRSAVALIGRQPAAAWHLAAALAVAAAGGVAMRQVAAFADASGSPGAALAACVALLVALAAFGWTAQALERALGAATTRRACALLAAAPASFFWQRAPQTLAALPRLPTAAAAAPWLGAVDLALASFVAAAMFALAPAAAALPVLMLGLSLAVTAAALLRRGSALPDAVRGDPMPVSPGPDAIAMLTHNRCGGRDGELFAQLAGGHALGARRRRLGQPWAAGLHGLGAGLRLMALAGGLGVGLTAVAAGWTTGGDLIAVLAASIALDALAVRIVWRLASLPASRVAMMAWRDLSAAPSGEAAPASQADPRTTGGDLVFAAVSAGACPGRPALLAGFSCAVSAGAHVAVEGPAGSGKTLLLRLACGLSAPEAGLVTLGGQPVVTAATRPGHVGCLGRGPAFARASVRETLTGGSSGWSDHALEAVLVEMRLWDAIAARGGLELGLTQNAPELSGGQRARLVLARALLREPALLCLDATLDSVEADLQVTLLASLRRRGCTVLLVSHHEALRAACDRRLRLPFSGGGGDAGG